ncbi:MAG: hypothetical protein NXI31_17655 [bacterium]|nr:hypothetical protein [bacterium]
MNHRKVVTVAFTAGPRLATLFFATAVAAQSALDGVSPPSHVTGVVTPIHTGESDSGFDYGIWAAALDYKVSFHDGVTFVPYLGRGVATNRAWRWRTLSARIGGLELVAGTEPRLSHGERRAEYDLGAIVEAYDVRAEGLEQTFVIPQRPSASGGLLIRGQVSGNVTAPVRGPAHAPVVFSDTRGDAVIEYGAATAVDADGRRCAMTTAVDGGEVTLRLEAPWLESARYPVVVDPLIGVFHDVTGNTLATAMDIMHMPGGNGRRLWFARERWSSASDADIWMSRSDDNGNNLVSVFNDISATWSTTGPSLGRHQRSGYALLAFARHFSNDLRRIRLHRHERNDFTLNQSVFFVDTGVDHGWRPDVAIELDPLAPRFLLVVFQVEDDGVTFSESQTSEIKAALVDLNNEAAGSPFEIATSSLEDFERPTIAGNESGSAEFAVAYQVIGNTTSPHRDWDVQMRRTDRSGTLSAAWTTGFRSGYHELAPRLAGHDEHVVLAFTRADPADVGPRPTSRNGDRILAHSMSWGGGSWSSLHTAVHDVQQDPRLELNGLGFDRATRSHAVMAFRSTATENIYLRVLGYRMQQVTAEVVHLSGGNPTSAGVVAYDASADDYLVAYGVDTAFYPANVDRYQHVAAPLPTTGGLGCSAASFSWIGSQLIGDEDCRVRLDGLSNGALGTVLVGLTPINQLITGVPVVQPGCWLNVPNTGAGALGTMPFGFGPTLLYDFDLPEWLPPLTLYFQGVHFDAANTTVVTTERFAVPVVK